MSVRNVDVFYGDKQAIFDVNIDIKDEVIAMIGPSVAANFKNIRMNDTIDSCVVRGEVTMDGEISMIQSDVVELRARGMVFQTKSFS